MIKSNFIDQQLANTLISLLEHGDVTKINMFVLKTSVNVNLPDSQGRYPVETAIRSGGKGALELLLHYQLDLHQMLPNNQTLLHIAARYDRGECLTLLKHQGLSLDAADEQGNTPLHIAVKFQKMRAVKTLIGLGAAVDCENEDGIKPAQLALEHKHASLAKLLLKYERDAIHCESLVKNHSDHSVHTYCEVALNNPIAEEWQNINFSSVGHNKISLL